MQKEFTWEFTHSNVKSNVWKIYFKETYHKSAFSEAHAMMVISNWSCSVQYFAQTLHLNGWILMWTLSEWYFKREGGIIIIYEVNSSTSYTWKCTTTIILCASENALWLCVSSNYLVQYIIRVNSKKHIKCGWSFIDDDSLIF